MQWVVNVQFFAAKLPEVYGPFAGRLEAMSWIDHVRRFNEETRSAVCTIVQLKEPFYAKARKTRISAALRS